MCNAQAEENKINTDDNMLRVAGFVKESTVDGPGFRYTIFTQGCPHHCKGCHNPETHSFEGGKLVNIDNIAKDISKNPLLRGVTISGGDPFMQARVVANLIDKLDKRLTVMVYTGFEYEYLVENANDENGYLELLKRTDVLIDGKFEENLKTFSVPFRGSSNQRAINAKESLEKKHICLHDFNY